MRLSTKILTGLLAIFLIASFYFYKNWQYENKRAERMIVNYNDVVKQNYELNLKYSELNEIQRKRFDRLTDSLKIKTKKVKEYVYVNITDTIHDTIRIELTLIEPITMFNRSAFCSGTPL